MEIEPAIWRRIQVPGSYSFWDLHVAIQDVMGWKDCHLHQFEMLDPSDFDISTIGIPDEEDFYEMKTLPGWKQKIVQWFSLENKKAKYVYDFGDDWQHKVELEEILDRDRKVVYPICIEGERACPPEDCGGIEGYERLCQIMKDKDDEEYDEMLTWLGGVYDPAHFDVKEVCFDDPNERFKIAFS